MKRDEIMADFAKAHLDLDDGLAFRTDGDVERVWHAWIKLGKPEHSYVGIETLPDGSEHIVIETSRGDFFASL